MRSNRIPPGLVRIKLEELKKGRLDAAKFARDLVPYHEFGNRTIENIKMYYVDMIRRSAVDVYEYSSEVCTYSYRRDNYRIKVADIVNDLKHELDSIIYKMDHHNSTYFNSKFYTKELENALNNYNLYDKKLNDIRPCLAKAECKLSRAIDNYHRIVPLLDVLCERFVKYKNFKVYSRTLFYTHTIDTVDAYIPMIVIKPSEDTSGVNWYFVKLSIDKHVKSCTAPTRVGIEIFKYDQSRKIPAKYNLTPREINIRLKKVNPFPGDRFIAVKKIVPDVASINRYIVNVLRMLVEIGFEF